MAGRGLTRGQESAISALLTAPSIPTAAERAGIGVRTLERWLSEDAGFMAAYRRARSRAVESSIGSLQGASGDAVDALVDLLQSHHPPHVRVRAATAILDRSLQGIELYDLAERIADLEGRRAPESEDGGDED